MVEDRTMKNEKKKLELENPTVYQTNENCQVFTGPISGCVFAMPGATVNLSPIQQVDEIKPEHSGQVNDVPSKMPHTEVEVGKDTNDDDQDDDDALAVVGKCFKFMSGYVKGKVGTIVKQYCVSQADLALIEITLYYHGLLYKRNAHKAFAKALVAWGILKAANDDEITAIVNCIKDKYTSLPKEGGYKGWNERFQNDKETCVNIGQELGDTMPYKA